MIRPEELPSIRHLPLFCNMSSENFEKLMQGAYAQSYPAGTLLVEQGAPADFLFIVLEGSVEMFAHWDKRESTMAVIGPVGSFILAACIKDAPYLMSARTLQPSRLVLLPAPDLRAVFRHDAEFAVSVIDELAGAFRSVMRHAKSLKLRDARQRIAAYLLEQSRHADSSDDFTLQVEKRLIASYLGMTPENLSRGLRLLVDEGVRLKGMRVTIEDRAKLIAFVQPNILLDGPDPQSAFAGIDLPPPVARG